MTTATAPFPSSPKDLVATRLMAHRDAFKAFLTSRVGNPADAEDLLQNGLVKALSRADDVKDGEKIVAWFYQILRHVIVDHHRSRTAAARRDDRWAAEAATLASDDEAHRQICNCLEQLLPTLKPTHATLLRRIELQGEPVAEVAAALGMTPNHASVTLHRARGELRARLVRFCGDCQCRDLCDCD